MTVTRAKSYKGLGRPARNVRVGSQGAAGSQMLEPRPQYIKADNERIISDSNGSFIVLGRDRPGSRISGYGHEHRSARIDMVVGRVAADGPRAYNENNEALFVDNSFKTDAARIYISEKADIDTYFNLKAGTVGMSKTRSAVGIKADAVRIIAREGIKLVTRPEARNSQGGLIEVVRGIDLIAGNDDTNLEPLVKGGQIIKMFNSLIDWVGKLDGIVDGILLQQMTFNTALTSHTHLGVGNLGAPVPVLPSIDLAIAAPPIAAGLTINGAVSLKSHRMNLEMLRKNYLSPYGRGYICSRYNNTN